MKIDPLPILYTPEEVAEAAKVSRRTVYRWIKSGYLPARKVGLGEAWTVTYQDLRALLSGSLRGRKLGNPDPTEEAKQASAPSKVNTARKRRQ